MMRRERGIALLLVLWATMLLGTLLIGLAATARSHIGASLSSQRHVRAELAARAGLAHAIAGLRPPDLAHQWVPDGRPYHFDFGGAKVTVRVVDISGLIDLNAGSLRQLQGLFEAAGVGHAQAARIATDVVAWRGSGDQSGSDRALAGANRPHKPFRAIEQLVQVHGMNMALYDKVQGALTVYSGRSFPNASYSGPLVLAASRGISTNQATSLVDARRKRHARRHAGFRRAIGTGAAGPVLAGYGGTVDRVFSTAKLPDGTQVTLDTTIHLVLTASRARPYRVLAWHMDSGQRTVR